MTELIYPIAILGTAFLAGITFWHARGGAERIAFLGTAIVFGFLVEMAVIVLFGLHSYPTDRFILNLWAVPVVIPLAWGVIIYASFTTGRYLGLQRRHMPVFAGLFALHIALAIEVTAIRIPFWTWHVSGNWFDVPVVNFVGWYCVAFLFTGFFLYLEDTIRNSALAGSISLLASTGVLLVIIDGWLRFVSASVVREALLFGTLIVCSLIYLARVPIQPGLHLERFPVETFSTVLLIHLFYLQTLLYYGYYQDGPLLLYVSIAMLLVGIGVHYLPFLVDGTSDFAHDQPRIGNR